MTTLPSKRERLHSYLNSPSREFIDLELAHESGNSLIDCFTAQGRQFCLLTVREDNYPKEAQENKLTEVAFAILSIGLGFIVLRGFENRKCYERPLYALLIPSQIETEEEKFFQLVKPLISHPDVLYCVSSSRQEWTVVSQQTESEHPAPGNLKRAWSKVVDKAIGYAEALYCTGGAWSKVAWRSVGLISAVSGPHGNVLQALGNRFQKAPVGSVITVDGVEYRCIDHRIWSDGKKEFLPKGKLFHQMANSYSNGILES